MLDFKFTNVPKEKQVHEEYMVIGDDGEQVPHSLMVANIIAHGGEYISAKRLGATASIMSKSDFLALKVKFLVSDVVENNN